MTSNEIARWLLIGFPVGAALGAVLGLMFNNIIMGTILGITVGPALFLAFAMARRDINSR